MVRFVLGLVVRVHAVRHVRRHEETRRQGLLERRRHIVGVDVLVRLLAGGALEARGGEHGQPPQDRGQEVGVGPVGGQRADLLVVEARDQPGGGLVVQARAGRHGRDQAHDGAVRHVEVVEPRREEELVIEPAQAGLLRVVEDQLEVDDRVGRDGGVRGDHVEQVRVVPLGHGLEGLEVRVVPALGLMRLGVPGAAPAGPVEFGGGEPADGVELCLLVGFEVGGPVQVDGQGGDAQQGLVDLDELLDEVPAVAVPHQHAAGDGQVSVEPGVPDAAAVGLDADLQKAGVRLGADGLDAQARRIGMRADHGDGVAGAPFLADGEGHDG